MNKKQLRLHNQSYNESCIEELQAYGFNIEKKLPYHWRITKPDYEQEVDIWTTSNKMWIVSSVEKAKKYENLLESLLEVFTC
jgi:uroporphyrinogen-III synthase